MATYDINSIQFGENTYDIKDETKVAINQGTANAGKFLIVNSQGNVEAVEMSVWQGGTY